LITTTAINGKVMMVIRYATDTILVLLPRSVVKFANILKLMFCCAVLVDSVVGYVFTRLSATVPVIYIPIVIAVYPMIRAKTAPIKSSNIIP